MTGTAVDALFLSFQDAVIGRYSLERELGRGGMGVVYLAREVRLDRLVAIKLLPPDLAAQPELRDRFMREARTAAGLAHPYIVPIHAVDEIDGFVFIVMAYVDGGTLAERVAARGPLPPAEVTRIMREVAWALAYAHAQGVVHRDIKPANILLERGTGRAMVVDFGIARLNGTTGHTGVGMVLGTPEFMSPEQAAAEDLDGRSDLYSLGVVAYYAATGSLPFTAPTVQGVLAQHLTQAPVPVAMVARATPRSLAQAIDRCLEKTPAARFPSGESLADALEPAANGRTEVPVPIRIFLDRRRMAMLLIPGGVALPAALGAASSLANQGAVVPAVLLMVGSAALAVGLPFVALILRLRHLLRHGYGLDDVTAGLRASFERRREEFQYEFGTVPTGRERLLRRVRIGAFVVAAGAIAARVVTHAPAAIPTALASLYVSLITSLFSSKWRRLRVGTGPFWERFWSSGAAKRLARLASFRLGTRAVPADRPTELAIAMSAEAMFDGFPKELRRSLGDVPAILHELEGHARAARARVSELDAAIADAQGGPARRRGIGTEREDALVADLTLARDRAEGRLAELVTALESLRLDLLRLRAGGGSTEGITRDIAVARAFGEEADRLLAGAREVSEVLSAPATEAR